MNGTSGGGGEYAPQTGFGWTNGVVFEFLKMFPDVMYKNSKPRLVPTSRSAVKFEPIVGSSLLRSTWSFYEREPQSERA